MKRITITCAVTALLCGFLASSQANLITNGSFENGNFVDNGISLTDNTMELGAGATDITGWTVTTTSIAWIATPNPFGLTGSAGSSRFLDLTGYHTEPYGGVAASTAITTVIGQQYRLGFDLGSDPTYNTSNPVLQVSGTDISPVNFTATTIGSPNHWDSFSLVFTASSTSIVLSFAGIAPPNGQNYVGLDNISLVVVPETTTIIAGALLLLPFGASTIRHLRKNRMA